MVRHLRLTQLLKYQGFSGKDLKLERSFEHKEWKEDGESLPTIKQVRKMHETLGTWDKHTKWEMIPWGFEPTWNNLFVYLGNGNYKNIKPKANYKPIKKCREAMKAKRWKEQENRTLEFFEREGI